MYLYSGSRLGKIVCLNQNLVENNLLCHWRIHFAKEWVPLLALLETDIDSSAMLDDIHAELAQLRSERSRWINLFGAGGKLGYNRDLEKYIRPENVAPLTQLSAVTLTDHLRHGLPEVTSETHLSDHEVAAHQTLLFTLLNQRYSSPLL